MKYIPFILLAIISTASFAQVKFTTDKIFASSGTTMNTKFSFEIHWGHDEKSIDTIIMNGQMLFVIGGYSTTTSVDSWVQNFKFVKDPSKGRLMSNMADPYHRIDVYYASQKDLDNDGKIKGIGFIHYHTGVYYWNSKYKFN